MNKIILTGIINSEPTLSYARNGKPVCNVQLVAPRRHPKAYEEVEADVYNLNIWNTLATVAAHNLTAGQHVYVEGCLNPCIYKDLRGRKKLDLQVFVTAFEAFNEQILARISGDSYERTFLPEGICFDDEGDIPAEE